MRKGQVSLFIIIGILLLFIFTFLFQVFLNARAKMPPDQQMIYEFVTDCLSRVSEDALVVFGKQGRLEHDATYDPLFLEYYYRSLTPRVPTPEIAELELSRYVDQRLDLCIKQFDAFPVLNFTYIAAPDTKVTLTKDAAVFDLSYALKFEKQLVKFQLDEFHIEHPVALNEYLSVAQHLVEYYARTQAIDASYDLLQSLDVDVYKHNRTLIVALKDHNALLSGEPYTLAFAVG